MAIEDREDKEKKIKKEIERLTKIYAGIEPKRRLSIKGLIGRAAFLRISMEYLEEEINIYGYTEPFSQGDQDPYERKRPTVDIYNSMNGLYQKIIKQLTDLLPKEEEKQRTEDGFDDFVFERDK